MESSSWPESSPSNRIKAIQELTKGRILTNKLRDISGQPEKIESDLKSVNGVVVQIIAMFYNTLSILHPSNHNGNPCIPTNDVRFTSNWDDQKPEDFSENIEIRTPLKTKRGRYSRRKNVSTFSKVTSTLIDDGYAWRKYGQKLILNSKHQRNYYRCSHKYEQGCQATKQVQQIDNLPSKYQITYSGVHTCNNSQITPQIIVESPDPLDNSILINFKTNALTENNKLVGSCFQSILKHTPNEGFSSLVPMKQEQVSSSDHVSIPWDPIMGLSEIQSEIISMMTSALDREDMDLSNVFLSTCHTRDNEIGSMSESNDYSDLLFDYVDDIM